MDVSLEWLAPRQLKIINLKSINKYTDLILIDKNFMF